MHGFPFSGWLSTRAVAQHGNGCNESIGMADLPVQVSLLLLCQEIFNNDGTPR